ncbi:MAG: ATP-dependent DNA helicase [Myxococcota bacterium]
MWPELEAIIGPRGLLATRLPGFERRAGQELMMRAVATALERRRKLVVEAGTGIGKSLAYLLPAALSGQRVILSTGTKTLQDQLWLRQVPFVRDTLGVPIEVAVLKGRANYLCLLLLGDVREDPRMTLDQHVDFARISRWAETTTSGDRAELAEVGEEAPAWRMVAADAERCLGRACPKFNDCFLMSARRRAESADRVIVNHHLFFADLALRDGAGFALLPDAHAVVFDEAHRLEDVAANAFGTAVSDMRVRRLGKDAQRAYRVAERDSGRLDAPVAELERDVERLWKALVPAGPAGDGRVRLDPKALDERQQEAWFKLDNTLIGLGLLAGGDARGDESIGRIAVRIEELRNDLQALFDPDVTDTVRWIERGPRATYLRSAPIEVGARLDKTLYQRFHSVVFTSATLAAAKSFDHFRERMGLGAGEALELSLPSPFDYAKQALLYLPNDLPDPQHAQAGPLSWPRIAALVELTRGRALLLFTSRKKMVEAHQALARTWAWPTLVQGEGPKERLVDRFRETPGAVLFATQTFWEGVDVIGDALSLVVIDKLPFAAPGDPVVDARVARLGAAGRNAFSEYQVPAAILALKQGVGRLIRHRDDRGIVAILDPRVSTARYGRAFLDSLPPARRSAQIDQIAGWWRELEVGATAGASGPAAKV